jgi:hypothetical protein
MSKTIYYNFDENIINEYELNDDILIIKGKETYINTTTKLSIHIRSIIIVLSNYQFNKLNYYKVKHLQILKHV